VRKVSGDLVQIRIDGNLIGLTGLGQVIREMAAEYAGRPDAEVAAEMLRRLASKNYIPGPVRDKYGRALVREFRKFLGQPYEAEKAGGLEIKVLGQGCTQCDRLEKEVMAVLAELNLKADLRHVTDLKEIGRSGALGMPALMVNGRIVSVGSVPSRAKIKEWLKQAEK